MNANVVIQNARTRAADIIHVYVRPTHHTYGIDALETLPRDSADDTMGGNTASLSTLALIVRMRTRARHTKHVHVRGHRHTYGILSINPVRTTTDVVLAHEVPVIAQLPLIVANI